MSWKALSLIPSVRLQQRVENTAMSQLLGIYLVREQVLSVHNHLAWSSGLTQHFTSPLTTSHSQQTAVPYKCNHTRPSSGMQDENLDRETCGIAKGCTTLHRNSGPRCESRCTNLRNFTHSGSLNLHFSENRSVFANSHRPWLKLSIVIILPPRNSCAGKGGKENFHTGTISMNTF